MRRCNWCGVELRWWQVNNCRVCAFHFCYDMPSPPCSEASRWAEPSDSLVAPRPTYPARSLSTTTTEEEKCQ